MARKRLINDMVEVTRGSDSKNRGGAKKKTQSESHVRFFTDHSEDTCDITAHNRDSASQPAVRQRGVRQTYTESKMRFLVSALLDVDVEAALAKRRDLEADDALTSVAITTQTKTEIFSSSTPHA